MESASVIYQKITYNMREMTTLNSVGQRLYSHLVHASEMDNSLRRSTARAEKVNVVGAGGALTAAYEQLRNAAENTEEHLLLQTLFAGSISNYLWRAMSSLSARAVQ